MFATSLLSKRFEQLRRMPVTVTIGVAVLALGIFPAAADLLQFERADLQSAQLWRLITCHLTHWNWDHLSWDLLMFFVLGGACELRNPARMRTCLIASAAAVTATVFWVFPDIAAYRGLSGVDSALFALLAIGLLRQAWCERRYWQIVMAVGLMVGFAGKMAFEAVSGQTLFVDEQAAEFVPLVLDHVVGAAVGAVVACSSPNLAGTGRGEMAVARLVNPSIP